MKKILLFAAMLFIMVDNAWGQSTGHGYNLYGQLFGNATGVGVGLDSRFKPGGVLGYSAGFAFTSISWDDSYGISGGFESMDTDSKGIGIPLELNAILGNRASKFEIGVGMTAYFISRDETRWTTLFKENDDWDFDISHKKVFRPNIIGSLNIGYRLQRQSGFFMKLGVSVLVGDLKCSPIDGVVVLPNLCFGYTIPHF